MQRSVFLTVLLAIATSACVPVATAAEPQQAPDPATEAGVVANDDPVFPEPVPRDLARIWVGSYFAPAADFGGVNLSLYQPDLRVRTRVPIDGKLSAQLTADFRASQYETENGSRSIFPDCMDCRVPSELYAASLSAQAGARLNRGWSLFRSHEHWVLLGALYGRARWEPGAFEESLTPGVSLGIGYELPQKLRAALGARVERALDGDGVKVGPTGHLRWDFLPSLRLRNRGLGVQLEYRPVSEWEIFATGFRASEDFRLERIPGGPAGTTFEDRQVAVGGGFVYKLTRAFRITAETGAIVDRKIAVDARDGGRIDTAHGDVSPYFALRLELRP